MKLEQWEIKWINWGLNNLDKYITVGKPSYSSQLEFVYSAFVIIVNEHQIRFQSKKHNIILKMKNIINPYYLMFDKGTIYYEDYIPIFSYKMEDCQACKSIFEKHIKEIEVKIELNK